MTQQDRDALEPCPFCGGARIVVGKSPIPGGNPFRVSCPGCWSAGPPAPSEAESITAWNRRLVREDVRPEGASAGGEDGRECTCHPDDRPKTCQRKYALADCLSTPSPAPACVTPDMHNDACVTSEAVSRDTKAEPVAIRALNILQAAWNARKATGGNVFLLESDVETIRIALCAALEASHADK